MFLLLLLHKNNNNDYKYFLSLYQVTKRVIAPHLGGLKLRIFLFFLDYIPGLASLLFWNSGLNALRKLKIEECPTNLPLPIPKEYFGIEETKVNNILF